MKKLLLSIIAAGGALLAGATTFVSDIDAALTNATGWTYNQGVAFSSGKNAYYIKAREGTIRSPMLDFAVTSLTVIAAQTSTSDARRNLVLVPYAGEAELTASRFLCATEPQAYSISCPVAAGVDSIAITCDSGSVGNVYTYRLELAGVPFVRPPYALSTVATSRKTASFAWEADFDSVSNVVSVSEVITVPEKHDSALVYDFIGFTNDYAAAVNVTDLFNQRYLGTFHGSLVYVPGLGTNEIQLSTSKDIGRLRYLGLTRYERTAARIRAKKFNYRDEASTMTIAWATNAETNEFAAVPLDFEYTETIVDLSGVPDDAELIFNYSGKATEHRVILDEIALLFGYQPGSVTTNLVAETVTSSKYATVRGLRPGTEHFATVRACDRAGHRSEPALTVFVTQIAGGMALTIR